MWDILGDDYVVDEQFTNDGNEIVLVHMNVISSYMIFQKNSSLQNVVCQFVKCLNSTTSTTMENLLKTLIALANTWVKWK